MTAPTLNWYRTPIAPELLVELNTRSDAKALLQAGGFLGTMVATGVSPWLIYAYLPLPWMIPALLAMLLVHGTVTSFNINAVHELVHGTVFRTKLLNNIFVHIFAFIGWNNHYQFWASHTEHHKYTLHAPDDLEVVLPQTHSVKGFFKYGFVNPMWLYHNIRGQWRVMRGKWQGRWVEHILPDTEPGKQRAVRVWAGVLLLGHGSIIVACAIAGPRYWIIPVITSFTPMYGSFLFMFINNTQHCGLVDKVPDFRLCCRTITLNPVLSFLYWHMEYHTEHHMYAGVPCYHLKRLHRAVKHDLPPTCHGLVETWAQILYIQHRQKSDPDFQYVQPLPPSAQSAPAGASTDNSTQPEQSPTASATDAPVAPSAQTQTIEPAAPPAVAKVSMAPEASAPPTLNSRGQPLRRYECSVCGHIYDEAVGWPEDDIAPGTAWADIPDDWCCPDCGVAKADFDMIDITEQDAAAARA